MQHPDKRSLREGSIPSWFVFVKDDNCFKKSPEKRSRKPSIPHPPCQAKRARRLTRPTSVTSHPTEELVPSASMCEPDTAFHTSQPDPTITTTQSVPSAPTDQPVPTTPTNQPVPTTPTDQTVLVNRPVPTLPINQPISTIPTIQSVYTTPTNRPLPLRAVTEHNYSMRAAERGVASPVKKMQQTVLKLRYENKKLKQKLKRRDARLRCLKSTLDALESSRLAESDLLDAIRSRFDNPMVSELFMNEVVNGKRKRKGRRFSDEIKKLCLTFHYYSPRAYRYLAKKLRTPGLDLTAAVDTEC